VCRSALSFCSLVLLAEVEGQLDWVGWRAVYLVEEEAFHRLLVDFGELARLD